MQMQMQLLEMEFKMWSNYQVGPAAGVPPNNALEDINALDNALLMEEDADDVDLHAVLVEGLNAMDKRHFATHSRQSKHPRTWDEIDRLWIHYDAVDFRRIFRLSQNAVVKLVQELGGLGVFTESKFQAQFDPLLQCLLWLQTMSKGMDGSQHEPKVSKGYLYVIEERILSAMTGPMLRKYIKWPTLQKAREIEAGFRMLNGFPGVIGVVDGTHISVRIPQRGDQAYYCRKGYPAMQVQATCDHKFLYTDVFLGYPGSVHDARVFRNSDVYANANALYYKDEGEDFHVLGDSAYPATTFCLTPFRRSAAQTPEHRRYSYRLSQLRMTIEVAFGRTKSWFRILNHVDRRSKKKLIDVIAACFVLHNFKILHDGLSQEDMEGSEEDEQQAEVEQAAAELAYENAPDIIAHAVLEDGKQKRNRYIGLMGHQ